MKGDGKIALGLLGVTFVGYYLFIEYAICRPIYQMKMISGPHTAKVLIRRKKGGDVHKIKHKNIQKLIEKGYDINTEPNPIINYKWNTIITLQKENMTKEKLITDCKECDVYTTIVYGYDGVFGNEKYDKKKLYWHKNYQEELK